MGDGVPDSREPALHFDNSVLASVSTTLNAHMEAKARRWGNYGEIIHRKSRVWEKRFKV